jgi:hypothetical protein
MQAALNAYNVVKAVNAAPSNAEFSKQNPEAWDIYMLVEQLRRERDNG